MTRDLRDENFEDFLKRNADNLRMKAPDRVWQNLSGELTKGRRRFGASLSGFFLLASILGYLTINNTARKTLLTEGPVASVPETAATSANPSAREANSSDRPATGLRAVKGNPNAIIESAPARSTMSVVRPDEPTAASAAVTRQEASFTPTIVDDSPESVEHKAVTQKPFSKPGFLSAYNAAPLTIESVVNSYRKKNRRIQTEFHFTPTISYRKLSENKSYLRANSSPFNGPINYAALYNSVNNMVTHKPDIGFELGVTEKFSVSQKVRLRAGLQFNVNRYDIKAFKSPYYLATIALNNRGSSRIDSVYTLSNYSNVDGSSNKSSWLQNLSFQVSAPIGVELALTGNEKMQFGIATTVQPTYVLGDRAYLITADYKSYTQVPWLLRRWNVNTAFETFVSYRTGKTRWQVGPQVRYQLLSSFISNYPVKENLFDFGLRVGVSVIK